MCVAAAASFPQVSEGETLETCRKALLNKALEYYPELKDIHTCLESSLPLPPSASFLSRCGLVSMATGGFLFQVRPSDAPTEKRAAWRARRTIKTGPRLCRLGPRVEIKC